MKTIKEIEKIGFFEEIENKIVLIEWPEKIINKSKKKYELYFDYDHKAEKRFISIYKDGSNFKII